MPVPSQTIWLSALATGLTCVLGCQEVLGLSPGRAHVEEAGGGGTTSTATTTSTGGSEGGMGGAGGSGGDATPEPATSCQGSAPGATTDCGVDGDDDCCASFAVEGGTYWRSHDFCDAELDPRAFSATVSAFALDKYEVTVGRYRRFIDAYTGPPEEGAGAHEHVPGSGWSSSWPQLIRGQLIDELQCSGTWTADPDDNEHMPINCASWHAAFLFCEWDGGRLPTEAEWNYVAVRGDYHWQYPWGDEPPDTDLAVFTCMGCSPITPVAEVGSKPAGASHWGHLDLAGNLREWVFDVSLVTTQGYCALPSPCDDCAVVSGELARIHRGGSHESEYTLRGDVRRYADTSNKQQGFRCARALP